jgi:hypothetical protein
MKSVYPWWLKALAAFGAPFCMSFAAALAASEVNWLVAVVSAAAAGFGGLTGLWVNDTAKTRMEK